MTPRSGEENQEINDGAQDREWGMKMAEWSPMRQR